jgi:hypothetical protein
VLQRKSRALHDRNEPAEFMALIRGLPWTRVSLLPYAAMRVTEYGDGGLPQALVGRDEAM